MAEKINGDFTGGHKGKGVGVGKVWDRNDLNAALTYKSHNGNSECLKTSIRASKTGGKMNDVMSVKVPTTEISRRPLINGSFILFHVIVKEGQIQSILLRTKETKPINLWPKIFPVLKETVCLSYFCCENRGHQIFIF